MMKGNNVTRDLRKTEMDEDLGLAIFKPKLI